MFVCVSVHIYTRVKSFLLLWQRASVAGCVAVLQVLQVFGEMTRSFHLQEAHNSSAQFECSDSHLCAQDVSG